MRPAISSLSMSIPVCAGEPAPALLHPRPRKLYPRVCGGTSWWDCRTRARTGLSPRVRGNQLVGLQNQGTDRSLSPRVRGNLTHNGDAAPYEGSIPACAGEPCNCNPKLNLHWVYPRVCGGTIVRDRTAGRPTSVYPRVCGGTIQVGQQGQDGAGLSPRVRGNLSGRLL